MIVGLCVARKKAGAALGGYRRPQVPARPHIRKALWETGKSQSEEGRGLSL